MKVKVVVIILLLASLALAGYLYYNYDKEKKFGADLQAARDHLSNEVMTTSAQLAEQKKAVANLATNLAEKSETVVTLSNELTQLSSKLTQLESDSKAAKQTAQEELAKRDSKINELETQRDDLTKRMTELNVSISNLETQITDTEKKLAASEGDRTFLLKELKRLQAEKAELERQFNNVAFLREQVRRLRDEMSIARRLAWFRRGLYGSTTKKGAERLNEGFATTASGQTNYNLDVELRQDGSVRILSPGSTNAPANTTNTTSSSSAPAPTNTVPQ